jgi:hypothetical protein
MQTIAIEDGKGGPHARSDHRLSSLDLVNIYLKEQP